ncbi:MAG: ATP-binding protein [Clostridiales bacterium]|nr:ATP-binding protein [Clostridiales bacterium]
MSFWRRRIFIYSIIIVLASMTVAFAVSAGIIVENTLEDKRREMQRICLLLGAEIADGAVSGSEAALYEYAVRCEEFTGFRVTLIDGSGEVLADSASGENYIHMRNHSNREEVAEALAGGVGHARRVSESFGREFIYTAVLQDLPVGDTMVVRLSIEVDKARIVAEHARAAAAVAISIGVVLAVVIAAFYTRRLTRPIREMEQQLADTLEKNKKAENIRKEFVANVTHELKTPLTSISGFAETLQGGAGENPEARARFLEIISIEAARLARLIDDTLVISDIESGRDTMEPGGSIDIKQAVEDVLEALRPLAESNGVELRFEIQYEMHIGGDEGRFKQLIFNLAENAIKYSGDGKHVFIKAVKEDDGRICVSVRDEGIGILEEDIPRVFERFYRVDKSRSREAGGTGLGLAIVKHIAALFGATLSVESEVGIGSIFIIRFPSE